MRRLRSSVIIALASLVASLAVGSAAQAMVVKMPGSTQEFGVALVPGTGSDLSSTDASPVTTSVSTCDPYLSSDLTLLPAAGICDHGGSVMAGEETFALTWDPTRSDPLATRDYLEQYLKDVADASGMLTSPYAVTRQYAGVYTNAAGQTATGLAGVSIKYGGACIDYGDPGGYTCQFGDTTGTGVGLQYPAQGTAGSCTSVASPAFATPAQSVCLTDASIQSEVLMDLSRTQLTSHLQPGDVPLLVVLTPPNVVVCLDGSAQSLCSANATTSSASAQFCSYHSDVTFAGAKVAYVVEPWTAFTGCTEPGITAPTATTSAQQVGIDDGSAMASPLSAAQIAATVNPDLDGWFAENGAETDDNDGCVPEGTTYDAAALGQDSYFLQPEFSNAGVIDTDPSVPACAHGVQLVPSFVAPSPVDPNDVMQFDGSVTDSSLIVPKENYRWDFGDGVDAIGPSVEHAYAKPGVYTVTLSVMDRGYDTATYSHTVDVLGATATQSAGATTSQPVASHRMDAALQLVPQGLRSMLRSGLALRLSSNETADGIATISISRRAATRAHIAPGRGRAVLVGRGTFAGIASGVESLKLKLSRSMARKLSHLRHLTVTVRLTLIDASHHRLTVAAAGHY